MKVKVLLLSAGILVAFPSSAFANENSIVQTESKNLQEEAMSNMEIVSEKEIDEKSKYHATEEFLYLTEDVEIYDSDAEDKKVIFQGKKGDRYKCVAKDTLNGDYFIVQLEDEEGFIDAEKLVSTMHFDEINEEIYFTESTNIYELPATESRLITVGNQYGTIRAIGINDEWVRVQFSDNTISYIENKGTYDYTKNYQPREIVSVNYDKEYLTEDLDLNLTGDTIGEQIVEYATQFVGNRYVWGGTSLTHGADCSGFTQSVYHDFGVYINRTSYEQRKNGYSVKMEDARPGDLVMYDGHVGIYMGPNKMVHAANKKDGIMIGPIYYGEPVLDVRRIVD